MLSLDTKSKYLRWKGLAIPRMQMVPEDGVQLRSPES